MGEAVEAEYAQMPLPTSVQTVQVEVSYMEIYNEEVLDLLGPGRNLKVRQPKGLGVYVEGLTKLKVKEVGDMLQLIQIGAAERKVTATAMNNQSSRSHAILKLQVSSIYPDQTQRCSACLFLADLAGSEMVKKSGVTGVGLQEAAGIKQSLSSLGNVVQALTQHNRR